MRTSARIVAVKTDNHFSQNFKPALYVASVPILHGNRLSQMKIIKKEH